MFMYFRIIAFYWHRHCSCHFIRLTKCPPGADKFTLASRQIWLIYCSDSDIRSYVHTNVTSSLEEFSMLSYQHV